MLRPKREQPVRARLLGGGAAAAAALPLLLDEDIDIHEGGAAPVRAAHEPTRQLQLPWDCSAPIAHERLLPMCPNCQVIDHLTERRFSSCGQV